MVAIAAVLTIATIAVLVTRVASTALEATGVSAELAHFQARSAFTGVGFTTSEAEAVVSHPVRRRIMLALMLTGNAGLVSVVATLVLGFAETGSATEVARRLAVLGAGLAGLWWLTSTGWANRLLRRAIRAALHRWSDLEVRDYVQLLALTGPYEVREVEIGEGGWLAGGPLADLDLTSEGVLVLGVRRASGDYMGAPGPDLRLRPGDVAILYGREGDLAELEERRAGGPGERAHDEAVTRQQAVRADEASRDPFGGH